MERPDVRVDHQSSCDSACVPTINIEYGLLKATFDLSAWINPDVTRPQIYLLQSKPVVNSEAYPYSTKLMPKASLTDAVLLDCLRDRYCAS